jgi:hypothetical protein
VRSLEAEEETTVAPTPASVPLHLGFLTVLHEPNGYLGGYLVTNTWGRPLEFRLSTAVQPNRVQQILYGGTLQAYVCADLIGKTLVDKAGVAVQFVLTDREAVRDLRQRLEVPVLYLAGRDDSRAAAEAGGLTLVRPAVGDRGLLLCHPRFPGDVTAARALLAQLDTTFDLAEPFARIRDAIGEARKMGVARN